MINALITNTNFVSQTRRTPFIATFSRSGNIIQQSHTVQTTNIHSTPDHSVTQNTQASTVESITSTTSISSDEQIVSMMAGTVLEESSVNTTTQPAESLRPTRRRKQRSLYEGELIQVIPQKRKK